MAGVLVSAKTLRAAPTTNRRYPSIHDVEDLLWRCAVEGAWPVVHYNTRATGDDFAAELKVLRNLCTSMRGVQLNVVSPDPAVVRRFAEGCSDVEVILQVNTPSLLNAAKAVGCGEPHHYVAAYPGVRHALLDFSGGNGTAIDVHQTADDLDTCMATHKGVRFGVAGGLGPDARRTLLDLSIAFNDLRFDCVCNGDAMLRALSYDAESGVRSPVPDPIEGERYQDALDHDKALAYANAVCAKIRE